MTTEKPNDPFNLARFLKAQESDYARALAELKNGKKQSCWMWYIFPQLDGLGFSPTAKLYAIKSLDEAQQYLQHPVLGVRLQECTAAVIQFCDYTAVDIFGYIDNLKFRSSMTLFSLVENAPPVFQKALDVFFEGKPDSKTQELLGKDMPRSKVD